MFFLKIFRVVLKRVQKLANLAERIYTDSTILFIINKQFSPKFIPESFVLMAFFES